MKKVFTFLFMFLLSTALVGCGMTNTALENDRPDNIDVTDETLGKPPINNGVNNTRNNGDINLDDNNDNLDVNSNGVKVDNGTGTGTENNDEDYLDNNRNRDNRNNNDGEFNLPNIGG